MRKGLKTNSGWMVGVFFVSIVAFAGNILAAERMVTEDGIKKWVVR